MQTKKHPHLLAAPLAFLSLLAIVAVNAVMSIDATHASLTRTWELIETEAVPETIDLASGRVLLEPFSALRVSREGDTLSLEQGELLVTVSGEATFSIGSLEASTLGGALYLQRDQHTSTVVAMSGLLAVQEGATVSLVPAGYQLQKSSGKAPVRLPVPAEWLREYSAQAPVLSAVSTESSSASRASALMDALKVLTFPEAGQHALDAVFFSDVLGSVLRDLTFVLPALVRAHARQTPAGLLEVWFDQAKRDAAIDPESLAALLHDGMADLPSILEPAYPKQAELWRSRLTEIASMLLLLVPPSRKAQVESDLRLIAGRPKIDQPVSSLSASAVTEAPLFTDQELRAIARKLLEDHRALMASTTSITRDSQDSGAVRIESVFLSEDGRDVRYSFTYAPSSHRISRIVRDGTPLPNAVAADVFFPN